MVVVAAAVARAEVESRRVEFAAMSRAARIASTPQRRLFDALARCGELTLAVGPEGFSANLVGTLRVCRHGVEDILDIDDGRNHVHVDWRRMKEVEVVVRDGEGLLTVYDGTEALFRVYRREGPYPTEVTRFADVALWPSEAGEP